MTGNDPHIVDLKPGLLDNATVTVDYADNVNPNHYWFPGGVQTIDITRHMDFLTGNAVKYLTRAGRKGDRLTDLKKAERYIKWAIEDAEKANDPQN